VRVLAVAGAIATVVFMAIVVLQPGGPMATRNVDDAAQAAAPLLAAVPACWWAAARTTGRLRRFWALLALSAASWGLGQVMWCYQEFANGSTPAGASWASAGYLLAPVFAFAAVIVYQVPLLHWATGVRSIVDGLLIVATLLFASWTIASDTGALTRSGAGLSEQLTVLAYPAADIVLLALLATVASRSTRSWRDPLLAVTASVVALFFGDSSSIYSGLSGSYSTGSLVDTFWFTAFLLLALAAVMPELSGSTPRSEGPPPVWTEFITYVPFALALAIGAFQLTRGNGFDSVEQSLVLASGMLVVIRGYLFVSENRVLMIRLGATVSELQWLTLHDPLTGLANRTLYTDRLEQALTARSPNRRSIAVAYLDLDEFKHVNDTLGHGAGDELLRQVAGRLASVVRDEDTLARLSGDEFALLVTGSDDVRSIDAVLRRMLMQIDEPFAVDGHPLVVSASIGFTVSGGSEDAETLIRQADEAMYVAKHLGKDRVCRHDSSIHPGPAKEVSAQVAEGVLAPSRIPVCPGVQSGDSEQDAATDLDGLARLAERGIQT